MNVKYLGPSSRMQVFALVAILILSNSTATLAATNTPSGRVSSNADGVVSKAMSLEEAQKTVLQFVGSTKRPTPGDVWAAWQKTGWPLTLENINKVTGINFNNYSNRINPNIYANTARWIAFIEDIVPGAVWAPVGRSAIAGLDLMGAYFAVKGDIRKICDIPISTEGIASKKVLGEYLESNGYTLDPNSSNFRPFILTDYSSYSPHSGRTPGGAQSWQITKALFEYFYNKYKDSGLTAEKLHENLSFAGVGGGIRVNSRKEFEAQYLATTKGAKTSSDNHWFAGTGESVGSNTWNAEFYGIIKKRDGTWDLKTEPFREAHAGIIGLHLLSLFIASSMEFDALVQAEAKNRGITIVINNTFNKLKKGESVTNDELTNELNMRLGQYLSGQTNAISEIAKVLPPIKGTLKTQIAKGLRQVLLDHWKTRYLLPSNLSSELAKISISTDELLAAGKWPVLLSQVIQSNTKISTSYMSQWLSEATAMQSSDERTTFFMNQVVQLAALVEKNGDTPMTFLKALGDVISRLNLTSENQLKLAGIVVNSNNSTNDDIASAVAAMRANSAFIETLTFTTVESAAVSLGLLSSKTVKNQASAPVDETEEELVPDDDDEQLEDQKQKEAENLKRQMASFKKSRAYKILSSLQRELKSSPEYKSKVQKLPESLKNLIEKAMSQKPGLEKALASEKDSEKHDEIIDGVGRPIGREFKEWMESELRTSGDVLAYRVLHLVNSVRVLYKDHDLIRGRDFKKILSRALYLAYQDKVAWEIVQSEISKNEYLQSKLNDLRTVAQGDKAAKKLKIDNVDPAEFIKMVDSVVPVNVGKCEAAAAPKAQKKKSK